MEGRAGCGTIAACWLGSSRLPTRQAPANADDQPWGDDDRDASGENRGRRWAPSRVAQPDHPALPAPHRAGRRGDPWVVPERHQHAPAARRPRTAFAWRAVVEGCGVAPDGAAARRLRGVGAAGSRRTEDPLPVSRRLGSAGAEREKARAVAVVWFGGGWRSQPPGE